MFRWFEHSQVYKPCAALGECQVAWHYEDVSFSSADDHVLHGWFIPALSNTANANRSHLTFLLLHGNAGNIFTRVCYYDAWLSLGVNVFTFDYRGYGKSPGKPSEEGTYRDAQAAYRWLRNRGIRGEHIIALGESLGGGVASELGIREQIGGLILQNTFTSTVDLGCEMFPFLPVRRIARIKYDTLNKLPKLQVPVLIAHSRGDQLIGFHHAEKNFEAANAPKMLWELDGSHADPLGGNEAKYLEGLEKFLRAYFNKVQNNQSHAKENRTNLRPI